MGIAYGAFDMNVADASAPVNPTARINNFGVLGYCTAMSANSWKKVNGYSDLDTEIGKGPLREFLNQFYTEATKKSRSITVICATQGTAGYNSAVTQVGTGDSELVVTGSAKWHVECVVTIVLGALVSGGTSTAKISYDGGETYEDTVTIPATGIMPIDADLGLTLTFEHAAELTATGDTYSWGCIPKSIPLGDADTAGSILGELAAYFDEGTAPWPEAIHICDKIAPAGVTALNTLAGTRLDLKAPCMFTGEFRRNHDSGAAYIAETVAEYVSDIQGATEGYAHASATSKKWFGWILGYPVITGWDATIRAESPAGSIYGVMARLSKLSDSAGATYINGASNKLSGTVHSLQFTDAQNQTLNELGGSLIRGYQGAQGYWPSRMGTNAGNTSAYQMFDRMRVMILACGEVFARLFPYIDVDMSGAEATAMEPATLSADLTAWLTSRLSQYVTSIAAEVVDDPEVLDSLEVDITLTALSKASEITANLTMTERVAA